MPIVLIEDILRPRLGLNTVRDGGRGQLSAGGSTARLAAAFAAQCRGGERMCLKCTTTYQELRKINFLHSSG